MVLGRSSTPSMAFGRMSPTKIRHDGMARFDFGAFGRRVGDFFTKKALPWLDKAASTVAAVIDPDLGKAYDTVSEGIRQKRSAGDIIGDVAGQVPEILGAAGRFIPGVQPVAEATGHIRTGLENLGVNIPGRKRQKT